MADAGEAAMSARSGWLRASAFRVPYAACFRSLLFRQREQQTQRDGKRAKTVGEAQRIFGIVAVIVEFPVPPGGDGGNRKRRAPTARGVGDGPERGGFGPAQDGQQVAAHAP